MVISVIIPVFDVENYLQDCLTSVVEQTYPHLQIIIVNDGSPDNSHLIIEDFEKRDSRIEVINQKNAGLSAARNAGISVVKGDYIMFVDSDDWIEPNMCELMLQEAIEHHADVVMASYMREFEKVSLPRVNFETPEYFDKHKFRQLYRRLVGLTGRELSKPETLDSLSTVWSKLYNSSLLVKENILFENTEKIGSNEDILFNLKLLKHAQSAVGMPNTFYHYRKNNSASFTSQYKSRLFDQWLVLHSEVLKIIGNSNVFLPAFHNRVALSIIGLGLNECNAPKRIKEKLLKLKEILAHPLYRQAYGNLTLEYFPVHWRLFFWAAKHQKVWILYTLLKVIRRIISR